MDIPKTPVIPPDPQRPLFLMLPPEIRNLVYELIFLRDAPVLLHDRRAYYAQKPTDRELNDYTKKTWT
jgi:hypothetical protein